MKDYWDKIIRNKCKEMYEAVGKAFYSRAVKSS